MENIFNVNVNKITDKGRLETIEKMINKLKEKKEVGKIDQAEFTQQYVEMGKSDFIYNKLLLFSGDDKFQVVFINKTFFIEHEVAYYTKHYKRVDKYEVN